LIGDIIIGIIGAFIGDWLLPRLGIHLGVGLISAIVNATIGAVVLLLIIRLVHGSGGWGWPRGYSRRWYAAPAGSALAEYVLELGTEARCDVAALERVGDVGGEKADLRSAIEALALELEPEERLHLGEADHRVGELDLAAGAA